MQKQEFLPPKISYPIQNKIFKITILVLFVVFDLSVPKAFAEQTEIIREVQKKPAKLIKAQKEKIYLHSVYEYSWVKQGARKGTWRQFSNRAAYLKDNLQVFYIDSAGYERLGVKDDTIEIGSYQKIPNGYLRGELGFGSDQTDFTYKFKSLIELEQRLSGYLFFNLAARYLHYKPESGDVYIISPGLIQYFKDNYISAEYGFSHTESRGSAHFAILKGALAINERINLYAGSALGERLFDINILKADKQYGYVFFSGADIFLTRDFSVRIGGSYSHERPSFIKRSIDFGAKVKF